MTASAAIFNPASNHTAFSALGAPAGNSTSSSTDTGSNISANDFLTLLVTEMRNQDPTSAQDPNQYINQLVGVNSLQQLIEINQTLSGAASPSGNSQTAAGEPGTGTHASGSIPVTPHRVQPQPIHGGTSSQVISGNLSVPPTSPAAHRVAHALGTRALRF